MKTTLNQIRKQHDVICERGNYKGHEVVWRSRVTKHFHFSRFATNGKLVSGLTEGYTRKAGLLNALKFEQDLIGSNAAKKSPNTTYEYFKWKI